MAVFMINICKFNNCGIIFQNLGDLIQHIEDNHIDYDSSIVLNQKEEQQPTCLPLSYVLRFYTESGSQKENQHKHTAIVPVTVPSTSTPSNETEVEIKEELVSDIEDSNDSWTQHEEFSSDFILRYGSKTLNHNSVNLNVINQEKPFACPVPGCKKRYKNINGIKYHSKNGHKNEGRVKKAYRCHCGKSYKTLTGLKSHSATTHGRATMTQLTTHNGCAETLQVPVKALTLKSIALPLKTLIIRQDAHSKSFSSSLSSHHPSSPFPTPPSSLSPSSSSSCSSSSSSSSS